MTSLTRPAEGDVLPYRLGAKAVIIQDNQVLLIAYDDESGLHYNFPGGGIAGHEPIKAGLAREIFEETCARSVIGDLILAGEYFPPAQRGRYGSTPALTLYFRAALLPGETPRMPDRPDPSQIAVTWFPLDNIPDLLLPGYYDRLVSQAARPDIFTAEA